MNADKHGLMQEVLTDRIIKVFYDVYNELGHGFLESVYEAAMEIALKQSGLDVQRQVRLRVTFRGQDVGEFVADLLVNNTVFIELKAASALDASHAAQSLNQLRASHIEIGLLMNFGPRPEFKRHIFTNDRKTGLSPPTQSALNP